jgi:hypothetical protein
MASGRKTEYKQETADAICERIASGESLRSICRDDDMPVLSTVFKWLSQQQLFADQYTRAREEQAEALADEIIDIADESYNDYDVKENGSLVVNNEAIQRSKLRVEARKWVASKLKPKKYGDFQRMEHTGKDGGAMQSVTTIRIVAGDGSDSQPSS